MHYGDKWDMMKELVIKKIGVFLFMLSVCAFSYGQDIQERRLEKNSERIFLENYYYSGENVWGTYALIYVYCVDGYYELTASDMDYRAIGNTRYFGDAKVKSPDKKVSTKIMDKKLLIEDFIKEYLIKVEGKKYYMLRDDLRDPLFSSLDEINAVFFAAQYNYDFLLLGEDGKGIHLYLPHDYPKIKTGKVKRPRNRQ